MTHLLSVELPEEIVAFVQEQAVAKGFGSVSEYVKSLVSVAQAQSLRAYLAEAIEEGLQSPLMEITDADWARYHELARDPHSRANPS